MQDRPITVPRAPQEWGTISDLSRLAWDGIPSLSPFRTAVDGRPAVFQTTTRICADETTFFVHFACQDDDIWGTMTERDQPIYDEEVVEVFLAPGTAVPERYFEFEVSPNGVLFDAEIVNPGTGREKIAVLTDWDCPGLRWFAARDDANRRWEAALAIPWAAVSPPGGRAELWRANFYRIERPRSGPPEFSCWSPTLTEPADFHVPARFGTLRLPF